VEALKVEKIKKKKTQMFNRFELETTQKVIINLSFIRWEYQN